MKVSNVPKSTPIVEGYPTTSIWSSFFAEVGDALKGEYVYSKRKVTASGVDAPDNVIVNKQGYLITILIEWNSNKNLNAGTLTFEDKSMSMLPGNLMVIDGSTLESSTAVCENDVITLPNFTSSNGSIRLQGTVLTKNNFKEV